MEEEVEEEEQEEQQQAASSKQQAAAASSKQEAGSRKQPAASSKQEAASSACARDTGRVTNKTHRWHTSAEKLWEPLFSTKSTGRRAWAPRVYTTLLRVEDLN